LFSCGDGCDDNALVAQAGAANANGAILTCPCVIPIFSKDPAAVKLAADYKAKFNKDAALYTAEAYDAANMLIFCADGAAADGTVTRAEMLACMKSIKDFKGVSKTFNFDSTGEVAGGVINVYTVTNGAISLVGLADSVI
jgi:branched-chain amino acid transport system substrate-binding protein